MKRKIPFVPIVVFAFLVLFNSCQDDQGSDCLMSTGEVKKESRPVDSFHYIEIHDDVNVFLTQDSSLNLIEVEAGENLLPGISTRIDSGHLVIRNENTCDWVRSFDVPVNIYITFSALDSIVFRAAGNVTFTNTWKRDSIQFDIWEGAGDINLKLDVFKSRVYVHYGVTTVNLSGSSQVSYISNKGYGPVNAYDLWTNFTYLGTHSPNDCFVYVAGELGATINNIGNVYYKGHPHSVSQELTSSGKLIRAD